MSLVEIEPGRITRITLNHPESRNAMSEAMATEFALAVANLKGDSAVRVVILSGAGEAFSGGGHLSMLEEKTKLSREVNETKMLEFYSAFLSIAELPVPVIAALNGHAIGAAFCLSLACDIRLAVREAKMGLNFVSLGLHPGMGATYFLPRLVGPSRAAELLYTGAILTADEALQLGLVSQVYAAAELSPAVQKLAERIAGNGPQCIRELRSSLRESPHETLMECLKREARYQAGDYIGAEFLEGINAAKAKRKPEF